MKKIIEKADITMTIVEKNLTEWYEELGFKKKYIEQGIDQGELIDKQHILIKLLSKKFGLTEKERGLINSITDLEMLDKALEEIIFAETKKEILDNLATF